MIEQLNLQSTNLYEEHLAPFERALIHSVLIEVQGNQVRASRILGLNRNTLRRYVQKHGLENAGRPVEESSYG